MRAFAASVEEVFREAAARWTLVAYFALSSLFILIFAIAVNLDVVNGALAGAKLFGQSVQMGRPHVDLDQLVLGFESGFSGFLYLVGTFLALFATAHLVPRLQEKGTIDLYLSRPVGRVPLLLSRYVARPPARRGEPRLPHRLDLADRRLEDARRAPRASSSAGARDPLHDRGAAGVRVPRRRRDLVDRRLAHGDVRGLLLLGDPRGPREDRGGDVDGVAGEARRGLYWILPKTAELGRRPSRSSAAGQAPGRLAEPQLSRRLWLDGALRRRPLRSPAGSFPERTSDMTMRRCPLAPRPGSASRP